MWNLNVYSATSTICGSAKIGRRKHIKLMILMSAVELQPISESAVCADSDGAANGSSILTAVIDDSGRNNQLFFPLIPKLN